LRENVFRGKKVIYNTGGCRILCGIKRVRLQPGAALSDFLNDDALLYSQVNWNYGRQECRPYVKVEIPTLPQKRGRGGGNLA